MRNVNYLLSLTLAFFFAATSFAQTDAESPFGDLPPTNEYGKCYAKCKIPDVYQTTTKDVIKKEASTKLIKVPAVYDTQTEEVLVKEASSRLKVIPATFKTITEEIMIEPEKTKVYTVPAKYENRSREILVSPERGEWVKKKKYPNCFSQNPEDCYVACYEKIPAKYRTEKYQVLVAPATTRTETIPAKYRTVTKRVVDQEARTESIPVPAVYKTIKKRVLVSPETTRQETIPAIFTSVKEKTLVKKGGYTVWTEILCAEKTTSSKVRSVQEALKGLGYDPGPIDGVMGIRTQAALQQYQTDKGLPVGNLNMETLKALGM